MVLANLLKARPSRRPVCYHADFWSFYVKGWRHKYRRNPKIGERWNSALWLLGWEAWLTPSYTHLHVKFGSCDQRCAHKYTKESLKLGSAGTLSPWSVDVADRLKQVTPRICYRVKFCSSASKGVCINRRNSQNWGALRPRPLGVGREWPPKNNNNKKISYRY